MHEYSYGIIPFRLTPEGAREYLMVLQVHGGHWSFPKGHIDPGEVPEQTMRRELAEETGITECRLLSEPVLQDMYEFERNGVIIHKHVEFRLGEVSREARLLLPPGEISEARWGSVAELRTLPLFPSNMHLLDQLDTFVHEGA